MFLFRKTVSLPTPLTGDLERNSNPMTVPQEQFRRLVRGEEETLLFEYGKGMKGAEFMSFGISVPKFTLWNKIENGDKISAVATRISEQTKTHVFGRVYKLSRDQLLELDYQRKVGVSFRRKIIPIILPEYDASTTPHVTRDNGRSKPSYANAELNVVKMWSYVGINDKWAKEIDWDLSYYKKKGEFYQADIYQCPHRELQMPKHYFYSEPKGSVPTCSINMRSAETNALVRSKDYQQQEDYLREMKYQRAFNVQSNKERTVS